MKSGNQVLTKRNRLDLLSGRVSAFVMVVAILVATTHCGPALPGVADMTLRANDHVLAVGDPSVTVIEYGDFACGFCAIFATETFPALKQAYVDTGQVRWVYRHFPLHGESSLAAQASECAADQGMFWEYHDILFENRDALTIADLKSYAGQIGLDQATFDTCLESAGKAARVQEDSDAGTAAGVPGTPTFFIDGQAQVGALSETEFSAILDAAIAATGG